MAQTLPPSITALPAVPDRTDRTTFSARATAIFDALKNVFVGQIAAVASNVYDNAVDAHSNAVASAGSADTATTQAGIATDKAGIATTQAGIATNKAAEAATILVSVEQALIDGPVLSVNGLNGVINLKTINGAALTGNGNINVIGTAKTYFLGSM